MSEEWNELARLADAATPGDIDSAPESGEYGYKESGKWYECPACDGRGEVYGATYCNFDGVAMGVQFFGIGNEFKNYEAYFRAASPDRIKRLIAERDGLEAERDVAKQDLKDAIIESARWAREAGEAKGRLEMSEAAGIVDGWRERAEAAEASRDALGAEVSRLREALDERVLERDRAISALREVDRELQVPAAEYVPAIPAAWSIIDRVLKAIEANRARTALQPEAGEVGR